MSQTLINDACIRVERQRDRADPHSLEITACGLTTGRYRSFRDYLLFICDKLMVIFTLKRTDTKTIAAKKGGVTG
jgi:hypothetical protein